MKTYSRPTSLSSLSLLAPALRASSLLAPGLVALLGCASESVDLGGGTATQSLQRATRCAESSIVDADVIVANQADVAALEGCQEIRGDLVIQLFADADLSPLHDLQVVEGSLNIGQEASAAGFFEPDLDEERLEQLEALAVQEAALIANGWLASLHGLESLEQAGALQLLATSVSNLSELESLRSIGGPMAGQRDIGSLESGTVIFSSNPNLIDLTGFENVRGIHSFNVFNSPELVSLSGLVLEADISVVSLADAPALADLDALSSLRAIGGLLLVRLGMSDLSSLAALERAELLGVEGNAALADASALDNLFENFSLSFVNNASLRSLPSTARWLRIPDDITIQDNPVLESIELEFGGPANVRIVDDVERAFPASVVSIENNAQLRSVSVPAVESNSVAGLTSVDFFLLRGNPSLSSVDFGGLRRAGLLSIANNQSLDSVTLGALARVEDLEVTDNPQLSGAEFDDVATFERTLSGNLP
ncbi:MAG: hypothetical protein RL685_4726 [Pseudomonadota bacterium]